jgi:hypothetical protein
MSISEAADVTVSGVSAADGLASADRLPRAGSSRETAPN